MGRDTGGVPGGGLRSCLVGSGVLPSTGVSHGTKHCSGCDSHPRFPPCTSSLKLNGPGHWYHLSPGHRHTGCAAWAGVGGNAEAFPAQLARTEDISPVTARCHLCYMAEDEGRAGSAATKQPIPLWTIPRRSQPALVLVPAEEGAGSALPLGQPLHPCLRAAHPER